MNVTTAAEQDNPFFAAWNEPFDVPPFARIRPEHFRPAFDRALAEHAAEVETIASQAAEPSFDNTIGALERSGRALDRVGNVFGALAGAHTNDALQALERDLSPILARHSNQIRMNAPLFRRIEALFARSAQLGLSPEQARVLERYHVIHSRSGACSGDRPSFSQNVLADEQGEAVVLETEEDLAGLPDFVRAAARAAAEERGLSGKHLITLSRSSVVPFLESSTRRDLREKAFKAWIARGEGGGATDNRALIAEMVALRAERARLLGFPTFAHFRLADSMAKTPEAVRELLERVWAPARQQALADRDAMQELVRSEGGNFALAAWDWRHYADKLRKIRCDVDEAEVKEYLQLDKIIEAAFYTAERLFGLTVKPRSDVPVWHPDVRVWEVSGAGGRHMGLFFGDYYARSSKHSGAWMTTLRDQETLDGEVRPLVLNVMNFNKPAPGEPTLLSFDDAKTLFHEMGHALHALLSDVAHPLISGTSVYTDFVELPSQLYEHWLERPEVLGKFAVHHRTGEPMPADLLQKVLAARTFNQGFATVEFLSSALVDLDFHLLDSAEALDASAFERAALDRIGMPAEIVMRHRSAHFGHIFGGGYASGYYSYMWSEVLDADAFGAFEETGDIFDKPTAEKLLRHVYSAGGSRDPEELYTAFRGRLPTPEALLRRRGLLEKDAA
jgi:peptidyl-dipeptidase Dcp